MYFGYELQASRQSIVTLGGRFSRPRPILTVLLRGPFGDYPTDALIDTGSDDCVFPLHIAKRIGIDLTTAPLGSASGVGIASVTLYYTQVTLRIADNHEQREWQAWVGFTSAPLKRPLLGFAGFLQFFTATFHGDREEVELTVNSLYPGI